VNDELDMIWKEVVVGVIFEAFSFCVYWGTEATEKINKNLSGRRCVCRDSKLVSTEYQYRGLLTAIPNYLVPFFLNYSHILQYLQQRLYVMLEQSEVPHFVRRIYFSVSYYSHNKRLLFPKHK
jgi:type III secretory pathway component EscT